jgi:hypothetical protein
MRYIHPLLSFAMVEIQRGEGKPSGRIALATGKTTIVRVTF